MNQDQEQKNKLCELYVGQSFIGTKKAWEEHKKESQKSEESKTRFLDVKPCVSQATKDLKQFKLLNYIRDNILIGYEKEKNITRFVLMYSRGKILTTSQKTELNIEDQVEQTKEVIESFYQQIQYDKQQATSAEPQKETTHQEGESVKELNWEKKQKDFPALSITNRDGNFVAVAPFINSLLATIDPKSNDKYHKFPPFDKNKKFGDYFTIDKKMIGDKKFGGASLKLKEFDEWKRIFED
ncbi:10361_t:CDS:2 [Funneliformis geosporum]|nr:10361_t:CDS:2 [Funneliformis geosporum]